MAAYNKLTAEIERVLTSSYPVELKTLHSIVCSLCTPKDLRRWVCSWPCHVRLLAEQVLIATPRWPYAVELLTRLCHFDSIRDACLDLDPMLLTRAIRISISDHAESSQYESLAVLFVSNRSSRSMPSECQDLLLSLVARATASICEENVKQVYLVLQGAMASIINILSKQQLELLESQLLAILDNAQSVKSGNYSLYTLGAMHALIKASGSSADLALTSPFSSGDLLASSSTNTSWNSSTIPQFFNGKKAHKVLQLLVLHVIYACRGTVEEQATDTIALARRLLKQIPIDLRRGWCNQHREIVRKLEEKLDGAELDQSLRYNGLTFLLILQPDHRLSLRQQDQLSASLRNPELLACSLMFHSDSTIEFMLQHTTTELLAQTFANIPHMLASCQPPLLLTTKRQLLSLMQISKKMIPSGGNVSTALLTAVALPSFLTHLRALSTALTASPNHHGEVSDVCRQVLLITKKQSTRQLIALIFYAMLSHPKTLTGITTNVADLLAELHELSVTPETSHTYTNCGCPGTVVSRHGHQGQVLYEASNTKSMVAPSRGSKGWRQGVMDMLERNARTSHDAIVAYFEAICRDLERRCEDVESPLREAMVQIETVERHNASLVQTCEQQRGELQLMNQQHQHSKVQLDAAVATVKESRLQHDSLSDQIIELETMMQRAAAAAHAESERVQSAWDMERLEHATSVAHHQEIADQLQAQAETRIKELNEHEAQISQLRSLLEQRDLELLQNDCKIKKLVAHHSEEVASKTAELEAALLTAAERERQAAEAKKKLENLRQICSLKDEQLAASLAVREKMMLAMGLPRPAHSSYYQERQIDTLTLPGGYLDEQSSDPGLSSVQTPSELPILHAFTPSTSRQFKHRKSASVAFTPIIDDKHQRHTTDNLNAQYPQANRRPLQTMPMNASPRRPVFNAAQQELGKSAGGDDTTIFEGSDLISGTPNMW